MFVLLYWMVVGVYEVYRHEQFIC